MPEVYLENPIRTVKVDDSLYTEFLHKLDDSRTLDDAMMDFSTEQAEQLTDYVFFRLIEVDPGYWEVTR